MHGFFLLTSPLHSTRNRLLHQRNKMKKLKILCGILFIVSMVACTPKANDDGSKYVGHWVEKTKNDGVTAALDITNEGNGNYIVTEWQRDVLGDGKLTKMAGAASTIKEGKMLVGGVVPLI